LGEAEQVYFFVSRKIELLNRGDPGSKALLAKLRRGVGKYLADVPEIWEIILSDMPDEFFRGLSISEPTRAEMAIQTALTLYALHQQGNEKQMDVKSDRDSRRTFAVATRRLITDDNAETIKKRFDKVITASDLTELSQHARGLIQIMKAASKPIQIDYSQFAKDLYYFQFPEYKKMVLLSWGRDFYKVSIKKEEDSE